MHVFPLLLIAVFFIGLILTVETAADPSLPRIRPFGLFGWLSSGNWPAKVGAILLVIGIGALLRYALIHVDIPPQFKLGSGIVLSAVLGALALALKNQPGRRPIELALAGSAFGVAYLTAYSAYGYFGYINSVNALALLALVAAAAGLFAVRSNAISVAVLAMAGAYVAPRFAIGNPGPLAVYGYYLAASALTLVMVMLRGWRPLIHLSFLFTLAGALFFGWSGKFYEAQHYSVMQPLLLALAAVHLAMPLLERRAAPGGWTTRFDHLYFLLLPAVAAGLTLKIAPLQELQGALGLAALALLWGVAAALLALGRRDGAGRYAGIAALLALAAFLCWGPDIPWVLFGLAVAVTALAVAPAMGWSRGVQEAAGGLALCMGALHIVNSIFLVPPGQLFFNAMFGQRMLAGALMVLAGVIAKRREIGMHGILVTSGAGWCALALFSELLRLDVDFWPQLVYAVVLGAALLLAAAGRRAAQSWASAVLLALFLCGWWAADSATTSALAFLLITPLVLLALAFGWRVVDGADASDVTAATALALLPLAALPWLGAQAAAMQLDGSYFEAAMATVLALAAAIAGRFWLPASERWNGNFKALHFTVVALALLWVTLFHIERGGWPVAFEMLALAYLMVLSLAQHSALAPFRFATSSLVVFAFVLVVQAMVLRVLGPDGVMDASDIFRIALPAVLSLMWAIFGAALAWRGTRGGSRAVWSLGALLLALAAVKLVLFDFGSLGQLGNILALIAAGLVFMGVAWFAPIPTPREPPEPDRRKPAAPPAAASGASVGLWFGVLAAVLLATLVYSLVNKQRRHIASLRETTLAVRPQQQPAAAPPLEQPAPLAADDAVRQAEAIVQGAGPAAAPLVRVAPTPDATGALRPLVARANDCAAFGKRLPDDAILYAGGAYGGRPLGRMIDQSGHEATAFEVVVNEPGKRVVLALGAYEPSIWTIRAGAETTIAGVFVTGYHRQSLAGLARGTPQFNASGEARSPCGYFHGSTDRAVIAGVIDGVFGRAPQSFVKASEGRLQFGSGAGMAAVGADMMEKYIDENGHVAYRQVAPKP